MRVVLLGLPGAGKSTQTALVADYYAIPSVSPGGLLRQAVREGTDIGRQAQESLQRGDLVPNHLVDTLVFGRLRQPDCERGFVLDGFPRTLEQANSLDDFVKRAGKHLTRVIYMSVTEGIIAERLSSRLVCPVCGVILNLAYDLPKTGDICPACHTPLEYVGGKLQCKGCKVPFVSREDDKPEIIKRRLQIQMRTLNAVLIHYHDLGLLVEVDATRPAMQVFDDIRAILGGKQRHVGGS